MKKILIKARILTISIIITLMSIATFFAVIFYFRWGGLRGLSGFIIGVLATGFLFMSKHPLLQVYREYILK